MQRNLSQVIIKIFDGRDTMISAVLISLAVQTYDHVSKLRVFLIDGGDDTLW